MFKLQIYGGFSIELTDGKTFKVTSAKQRGLLAILALSANGAHSRSWLQELLWTRAGSEHGRASLRRELANMRKIFGDHFTALLEVSNIEIRMRTENVVVIEGPTAGSLLPGISIDEPGFKRWLAERRGCTSSILEPSPGESESVTPVVAIIPFIAHGDAGMSRHFSDLLAMEVTRSLSRSKLISVISHLSSRQFAVASTSLETIQAKLGVDYLLHGSITSGNGYFRFDADFISVRTGKIGWSRTFTGRIEDVVENNCDVVEDVSGHIGQSIVNASVELAKACPLPMVESHALFMSALALMHRHDLPDFQQARRQLDELTARWPNFSVLHAWLANWHIMAISQGWSGDPRAEMAMAADRTARALDLNPRCPYSLTMDGMQLSSNPEGMQQATFRFDDALEIDPSNALAWLMRSRLHMFTGEGKKALEFAERACSLSPLDPHKYFFDIMAAGAHSVCGNFDQALKLAQRSLKANPRHTSSHRVKVIALEMMGRHTEACLAVKPLRRLEPGLTIETYLKAHPAGDRPTARQWADALASAGIPHT